VKATLQLPPPFRSKQNRNLTVFGGRQNLSKTLKWPERSEAACYLFSFFFGGGSAASAAAQLNCTNISQKQPALWCRSSQPCVAGCLSTRLLCQGCLSSHPPGGQELFSPNFFLTKCQKQVRRCILSYGTNLKTLTLQNVGFTLFKPLTSHSLPTPT